MFDSSQMLELRHVAADRYQRGGGGGAHKVHNSAKAYHDSRGYKEMNDFRRAAYEARVIFREICEIELAYFRSECRFKRFEMEGDLVNGQIPF